jgi:hypothetical protein
MLSFLFALSLSQPFAQSFTVTQTALDSARAQYARGERSQIILESEPDSSLRGLTK